VTAVRNSGREFKDRRLMLGLSQAFVASACGLSRARYGEIEAGKTDTLTVLEFYRIAVVLGLDPFTRLYPGGSALRDGAHFEKLEVVLGSAARPLVHRREVLLPAADGRVERRAWDADLRGGGRRTTIELEMRLYDAQAQERRIGEKRRDDPSDHFLLLVAGTRTNRRVLRQHAGLFGDLPRMSKARLLAALAAGRHPGTALVLV
jgi:transcriptional regulator with XRE-family HTH domain